MKLYGHPLSPRYRRIAVAAQELDVPLELVELNIPAGENRTPGYLAKNPMGKIPTFEDSDGWTLWESCAILAYLGEKYAAKGLFPADLRGRADALRWMFFAASHLEPAVVPLVVQKVINPMRKQPTDEAVVAAALKELPRFLTVLEAQVARQPWVLGERFSLVDIALGTTFDGLFHPAVGFDRGSIPNVDAWHRRLAARPSWSAARPAVPK